MVEVEHTMSGKSKIHRNFLLLTEQSARPVQLLQMQTILSQTPFPLQLLEHPKKFITAIFGRKLITNGIRP